MLWSRVLSHCEIVVLLLVRTTETISFLYTLGFLVVVGIGYNNFFFITFSVLKMIATNKNVENPHVWFLLLWW